LKIFGLMLLLLPLSAPADNAPAPQPVASPVFYQLREMKPTGFTHHSSAGDLARYYFEFQNGQGRHVLLYEETASARPPRVLSALRQAASNWDSGCSIDVECSAKAFCTGDCRDMYYELAGAQGEAAAPDRNRCKIQFLSCKGQLAAASAPVPKAVASLPPAARGK
jgi:hypothetical protein